MKHDPFERSGVGRRHFRCIARASSSLSCRASETPRPDLLPFHVSGPEGRRPPGNACPCLEVVLAAERARAKDPADFMKAFTTLLARAVNSGRFGLVGARRSEGRDEPGHASARHGFQLRSIANFISHEL